MELISAALDALDAGVIESTARTVRVFALQFASAGDRQMGETAVPGVASTLRNLYSGEGETAGNGAAEAIDRIKAMDRKKASAVVLMLTSSQFLPPLPRANAKDGTARSEPLASPKGGSKRTKHRRDSGRWGRRSSSCTAARSCGRVRKPDQAPGPEARLIGLEATMSGRSTASCARRELVGARIQARSR
jgi:hypothetical protein